MYRFFIGWCSASAGPGRPFCTSPDAGSVQPFSVKIEFLGVCVKETSVWVSTSQGCQRVTFCHFLSLFVTFCHFLSLFDTFWHFLTLFDTFWHLSSLVVTCHFLSLFVAFCHFLSLFVILSFFLSFLVTFYHFLLKSAYIFAILAVTVFYASLFFF